MNMQHPVVSVIMPTFNNREVIGKAVESVIRQDFDSWELIIVDDASTDGTGDFVRSHYKDSRITVVRMDENRGSGECRNVAIGLAVGQYIAVLDADDECLQERLKLQVGALESDPSLAVIASQVLEFGDWGGPELGRWPTMPTEIAKRQRLGKMPVAHPTVMFRREAIDRAGGYDPACKRAQDFALFLCLREYPIACLEKPLVMYRTQRPITLTYALRNQAYADLALRRYNLRRSGRDEALLPDTPKYSVKNVLMGVRSWLVRSLKEGF